MIIHCLIGKNVQYIKQNADMITLIVLETNKLLI